MIQAAPRRALNLQDEDSDHEVQEASEVQRHAPDEDELSVVHENLPTSAGHAATTGSGIFGEEARYVVEDSDAIARFGADDVVAMSLF
jgi:hypothetical protein